MSASRLDGSDGGRAASTLAGLWAAFRFLTVLPVPGAAPAECGDLARGVVWFPLVGAFVGALAAAAERAASLACGPLAGPVLAVAAGLLVTGGLHIDGLADTVDGLAGGGRDRERVLAIMRDSRVGSMGAAAVAMSVLARFALLASLSVDLRAPALIAAAAGGRLAAAAGVALFPYARGEGLGRAYAGRVAPFQLAAAGVLASFAGLGAGLAGGLAAGRSPGLTALAAISVLAAGFAAGMLFAVRLSRRLGGLTGDTYGAINECSEVAALFAAAAIWRA